MTFIDIEKEDVTMLTCPFCGQTMFDSVEANYKYGGMEEMKQHIISLHPESIEGDIAELRLY